MQDRDIPSLVRQLRERMGMTHEQVAQADGVTFSTVNQWENGRRRPQPFLVKRLIDMEAEISQKKKHER